MLKTGSKIALYAVLFALLFASAVGLFASTLGVRAAETPAEATKAVKISIDTQSSAFTDSETGIGGLQDDDYVVFGVSPLPIMVSTVDRSLKNDALGTWWNAWGEVEFTYDFWSPTPIAGMGGVNFENGDYTTVPNASIVDDKGYTSTCTDAGFVEQLSNGWLRRTVKFTASQLIGELYLTFQAKVSDLPDSGTIEMYYTNFKLRFAESNGIVDLFGSDSSLFSAENVNKVAAGEAPSGGAAKATDVAIVTGWGTVVNFITVDNAANRSLGASFEAVDIPDVCAISETLPDILTEGVEYDLLGYAASSGKVGISAIEKDGEPVDVTGADFSAYIFEESGRYLITYTAEKNNYTATLTVGVTVASEDVPVLLEEDVAAAIPETGYAHEAIHLGSVFATVKGEKNLPATPTVKNSEGTEFPVTAVADGFEFTPTAKKNDTYTVFYTAENDKGSAVSESYTITVTDVDKPVVSFNSLGSFNVGTFYSVSEIKKLISVTDISDGTVDIASLSIVDPLGNELIGEDTAQFLAAYSGTYTVKVVTAADTDGNATQAQTTLSGVQSKGLVLGMIVDVPEASRGEGVLKHYHSQIWNVVPTLALNVGDVITYEVMAYTEYSDGTIGFIPGVGGFSGQMQGSYAGQNWPLIHDLFDKTESLDDAGYSMSQKADLTDVLQDEFGNAVWYQRSYTVKSGDAVFGGGLYHYVLSLDTTAACGERIVVYYKNVNVYDSEGTLKQVLWDGTQNIVAEFEDEQNCTGVTVATLDVSPVEIAGKIPTTAEYGETLSLSKHLMKDAMTDTVLETEVSVKGPDGKDVSLTETDTGYEFTIEMLGKYIVTVIGSNGKYSTEKTYTITVEDDGYPVITFENDKTSYAPGDAVSIAVTFTDDIFSLADFEDKGCSVTFGGKVVEATVMETATGYTVSFTAAEAGNYTVLAYGTDGAGNETVETHDVSVAASDAGETSEGGCSASANAAVLFGAVALVAVAAAVVVMKRKA